MHWLSDPRTPLVFLMGPAGCGKTALAVAAAAKGLEKGEYDRVLLARVNIGTGSELGYLPGSVEGKNEPWVIAMMDEFRHWTRGAATE